MRIERLQVGVRVDVAVHRVGEPVESFPATGVGALGVDHELVVGGESVQRDALAVKRVQADRLSVERDREDSRRLEVDEGGGICPRAVKRNP